MVFFQAHCISKAAFLHNEKVCFTIITDADMKKFNAKDEYTEGLSEVLRSINTVELAFVMKEIDQTATKVSLRSKNIDLTRITQRFNGGGHIFAAGCTINKPAKIALDLLLEEIAKYLPEKA
jgi:phosphoesterase RecJ-like protein